MVAHVALTRTVRYCSAPRSIADADRNTLMFLQRFTGTILRALLGNAQRFLPGIRLMTSFRMLLAQHAQSCKSATPSSRAAF